MLSQEEANELLAAFAGEYSGQIEQAILGGEDREAVLERLYDQFVSDTQETFDEDRGASDWSRLREQDITPDHVAAWLGQLWDDRLQELE